MENLPTAASTTITEIKGVGDPRGSNIFSNSESRIYLCGSGQKPTTLMDPTFSQNLGQKLMTFVDPTFSQTLSESWIYLYGSGQKFMTFVDSTSSQPQVGNSQLCGSILFLNSGQKLTALVVTTFSSTKVGNSRPSWIQHFLELRSESWIYLCGSSQKLTTFVDPSFSET